MDESVGNIMDALERKGYTENTLVVFLTDQGGRFGNPPFTGGKKHKTLCEGGSRVPLILKLGNRFAAGEIETPVSSLDLFPTIIHLAGIDPAEFPFLDGDNLVPLINGETDALEQRSIISYRSYEDMYASIHRGKWKFIAFRSGEVELYDLSRDIAEENDLSSMEPEMVQDFNRELEKWEKEKKVYKFRKNSL